MNAAVTSTALRYVPVDLVDAAWRDGAHVLLKAYSAGAPRAAELLPALKSGDVKLVGHDGSWAAVQVQQFTHEKVLHVEAIFAPGATSDEVFEQLKAVAQHNGCAAIQGLCPPAVARLWARRFGFRPTYLTMRKYL